MGVFRKFIGALFIGVVLSSVLAWVVSGRLLDFRYLDQKANSTNFYPEMAANLPQVLSGGNTAPAEQAAMQDLLGDTVLQARLSSFLDQLQSYYKDGGPTPVLDLRDLAIQARSAGLEVAPDAPLNEPIVYKDPAGFKDRYQAVQQTKLYGPLLAIALLLVMMLLTHSPLRYKAAAKTLLAAALAVGVLLGIVALLPQLLGSLITSNPDIAPVAPALKDLVQNIGRDMAQDIIKIIVGLVLLAVIMWLIGLTGGVGRHFGSHGGQEIKRSPMTHKRPSLR